MLKGQNMSLISTETLRAALYQAYTSTDYAKALKISQMLDIKLNQSATMLPHENLSPSKEI